MSCFFHRVSTLFPRSAAKARAMRLRDECGMIAHRFGKGEQQFHPMLDDAAKFLARAGQETRNNQLSTNYLKAPTRIETFCRVGALH